MFGTVSANNMNLEKTTLDSVCKSIVDGSHNPSKGGEKSQYLMLSSKNIIGDMITLEEPRYLSKEDFELENKRTHVGPGDLLMTIVGSIGRTAIVPENAGHLTFQRSVAILHLDNTKIDPVFLKHCLDSIQADIEAKAHGSSQKGIYLNQVAKLPVLVPSLNSQKEFADFVKQVDKSKVKFHQLIESYDLLVKSRFVEMFGDPYISPKYARVPFLNCMEFNPGKSQIKSVPDDALVSFVPMECVGTDGSIDVSQTKLLGEVRKGYTYFCNDDVVFAKITPCFENGKVAIAKGCTNGIGFGTTEFHVARSIPGLSNPVWLNYLLKSDSLRHLASSNMTGTAGQKRVQRPFFEKLKIGLPPIEQQNEFADFVKQVDKSKFAERSTSYPYYASA